HRPTGTTPSTQATGGIVELHTTVTLLTTLAADPARHRDWAALITHLAHQHTHPQPPPHDPPARLPGAALRPPVQTRHRPCTGPPARHPAVRNEQDHIREHAPGGPTTPDHLHPPCRHDHTLHTNGGWRVAQPEPGHITWTSPMGRIHETRPKPI